MLENEISLKVSLKVYLIDRTCKWILFCKIYILFYRIREENIKFAVSFPQKKQCVSKVKRYTKILSDLVILKWIPLNGWYVFFLD